MMTTSSESTISSTHPTRSSWWARFQQQGYYFRYVAIGTIVTGMLLHLARLWLGDALTMTYIVTPAFDQYFALPIAYSGISGLLSWRRMKFLGRGHKAFMAFIIFYMVASIPIHVATWFTHSTAHLQVFPLWFSAVLQPFYVAVLVALWHLQFSPTQMRRNN